MPYVAEHEVVAPGGANLEEIADHMGPPPWRVPLIASPALRAVLWSWPAAYRSQTVPVVDGAMMLGEFGRIYFADFDQVRARERTVRVQILGE